MLYVHLIEMHNAAAPTVTDPAVEPSSSSPVPAVPIVIWCSSVVVVLTGAVAAASGAWTISALTILAGAVPFRRDELDLRAAKAASLMLMFVALLSLGSRVMTGGFDAFATAPDWLLDGVVGALALRALALWQESVRRWVDERRPCRRSDCQIGSTTEARGERNHVFERMVRREDENHRAVWD